MSARLRVMLVDDHYLVRVALSGIIRLEKDLKVCAEASTGEQAVALFRRERPDVTLMDLRLPDLGGAEATRAIRGEFPDARVIVLSTYSTDEDVHAAFAAGAMAYLLKSVQREELLLAIRKAAAGERHVTPDVAERLAARQGRVPLSPRELDVLRLMAGGERNREIAHALDISEGTVKLHVSSILSKLGALDRTEAVTAALQQGIIRL